MYTDVSNILPTHMYILQIWLHHVILYKYFLICSSSLIASRHVRPFQAMLQTFY